MSTKSNLLKEAKITFDDAVQLIIVSTPLTPIVMGIAKGNPLLAVFGGFCFCLVFLLSRLQARYQGRAMELRESLKLRGIS